MTLQRRVALLCATCLLPALAFAKDKGACSEGIGDRVMAIAFAKAEGFSENDGIVKFVAACGKERRSVKKCAVAKSERRELQKACFRRTALRTISKRHIALSSTSEKESKELLRAFAQPT
jgi:hypothetical protein